MFQNKTTGLLLIAPAVLFIAAFFVVPVAILISESLRVGDGWGISNFFDFFRNDLYRQVFWRTLRLATAVTVVAAIFGYICAFAILDWDRERRGMLMGLIILPLMISPVARTYAWIIVLGRVGFVNAILVGLGIVDTPLRFLFTETAVFIGLIQLFFPFMVLSLLSALENMPRDVVPAAQSLGASRFYVLTRVILPLTREGLVIGGTLVFTGSVTAYITPAILGGSKVLMLETLLYQRVNIANDYVTASVIAAILMATTLATNKLLRRVATARQKRSRS
ncbi:MAG: ABC transporter permease [Rhodospirillales bacterium]|nr:ABC transporter permease [Rhodospirillales bacterium]